MVYEFENPNFLKRRVIGETESKKIAEYVRRETPSYKLNIQQKNNIKQKIRNNTPIKSN